MPDTSRPPEPLWWQRSPHDRCVADADHHHPVPGAGVEARVVLPFFGIVSEIFSVFSRRPIFGYKTLIFATLSIAALSIEVWAHHMHAMFVNIGMCRSRS